jgi:hypothetical protein
MIRKRLLQTAAGFVLLSQLLIVPGCGTRPGAQASEIYHQISGQAILDQARYLSSRKFMGREIFSDEIDEAGRHIAMGFERFGLKPADPKNGFFQISELDCGEVGRSSRLSLGAKAFLEGRDFRVAAVGAGTVESQVVFVGYGATTWIIPSDPFPARKRCSIWT